MTENNPLPFYSQIKNAITQSIESGQYQPGDQLPSQRELCEQFHTSLMTMRRVLTDLQSIGIIRTIPGKGIYVNEKARPSDYGSLQGFEVQMARLGMKPCTKTLEARIITATAYLSQILHIQPGAQVVYIYRLRYADDKPISIYKVYVPHALCPGILEKGVAERSLFAVLREDYGLKLVGSRNTATAVLPDEEARQLLELDEPVALLQREQITFLDTGEIIEYSRNFSRGDRYCVQYDEGQIY
jgi:GntR family transcriptional regulator